MTDAELQEIRERLDGATNNPYPSDEFARMTAHATSDIRLLLDEVATQRDMLDEQRRTIEALMMGVEEEIGVEGTTPVLRYIGALQNEVEGLRKALDEPNDAGE